MRLLACLASFAEPQRRPAKLHAEAMEQGESQLMVAEGYKPMEPQGLTALAPPMLHQNVLEEREQIRAQLRQVRQWIEHHEPSSPVTILIKQADRMWGKRFSEIATMIPPDLMKAWDSDD